MAEIHVEPKRQQARPSWIWILIGLLIVAVAVYLLNRDEQLDEAQPRDPNPTSWQWREGNDTQGLFAVGDARYFC